jgi:ribonucleoside-diphosphate reductase alpha chain
MITKEITSREWELGVDVPTWGFGKEEYMKTIVTYLLPNETPRELYWRLADTVADEQKLPHMAQRYFDIMWNNFFCPATPIMSNVGTGYGLPISCFGVHPADDTSDFFMKLHESAMMTKGGGGVGLNINEMRPAGSPISGGGTSDGTLPFLKIYDTMISKIKQNKRTGAGSANMNVRHKDFAKTFLDMRETGGSTDLQIQKLHHTAVIDDEFMDEVIKLNTDETKLYMSILRKRAETGEPFIMYKGNVNRANPQMYKDLGLIVDMTNICTEITLYTDDLHSFVCCVSSMNASTYHLWAGTSAVKDAIFFLDGIMSIFLRLAKGMEGFANAVRFAEKGRPLGLGILGWHSFLIQEELPYISMGATGWAKIIHKEIQAQSTLASEELATIFGEPEWCVGYGVRNTHRLAIAPTATNALFSGGYSPNREPYKSVYFSEWSAKGQITRKNRYFEKLLKERGFDTPSVWKDILSHNGSVQHLDFLTKDEKAIYKSFVEIDQLELIKQSAMVQQYVDQAISLNISVPANANPSYLLKLHVEAYKLGIKTMYYCNSESVLSTDKIRVDDDCAMCQG